MCSNVPQIRSHVTSCQDVFDSDKAGIAREYGFTPSIFCLPLRLWLVGFLSSYRRSAKKSKAPTSSRVCIVGSSTSYHGLWSKRKNSTDYSRFSKGDLTVKRFPTRPLESSSRRSKHLWRRLWYATFFRRGHYCSQCLHADKRLGSPFWSVILSFSLTL